MPALKYWDGSEWKTVPTVAGSTGPQGDPATNLVTSVNGKQGPVTLTKADFPNPNGLTNVDNTSDAAKPLSAAQIAALADKVDTTATVTRDLSFSNGGTGGTVATGIASTTNGSFRMTVRLPVTTTQWRIKLRNWNAAGNSAQTVSTITLVKILHGDSEYLTGTGDLGQETGNFVGSTATTVEGTSYTIPGNGSSTSGPGTASPGWYTSNWVTNGADQFDANKSHLVAVGFTGTSNVNMLNGAGQCWYWATGATTNSAIDPATTVTSTPPTDAASYIPLDWVIEYRCVTNRKPFLVIGDGAAEGISGTAAPPTPALAPNALWRSPTWQWAAAHDYLVTHIGVAGSKLQDLVATGGQYSLWNRLPAISGGYEGAIIALGFNDLTTTSPSQRTLLQMQTDALEIVTKAKTFLGEGKPVYFANLHSRTTLNTAQETLRQGYNNWLLGYPTGPWPIGPIAGIIDVDSATKGTVTTTPPALNPAYTPDGFNFSYAGQVAVSQAYTLGVFT